MIASALGSAQDFIKTLKAHMDPPHAGGRSKFELTRAAWDNASFYLPNKDEVIVDWLLTRLLKDRARAGEANPILDSRYWQLLSDILCPPDETDAKHTDMSRTAKQWLLPLLNRIPLGPIVTAYFSLSGTLDERDRVALDKLFTRCLATMWPLATPKLNPDMLLECFGALVLHLTTHRAGEDDPAKAIPDVAQATLFITSSYRAAYSNFSNKKKLYTTFLQAHFLHWLQCIHHGDPRDLRRTPISDVYTAGIETLFSIDVLRNVEDHKCDAALRDAITRSLPLSSRAVLRALPLLFVSFVQSLKRNRNALFSQGSNNVAVHASMQVQLAGLAFYALCEDILGAAPSSDSTQIWDTRIALLETVDSEGLYTASDANGAEVLRRSGAMAVKALMHPQKNAAFIDKAEDVLAILTRIDYDLMVLKLPLIWPALVQTASNPSSSSYLRLLFEFHTKTRTVNALVDSWLDAVSLRHWRALEDQPHEAYRKVLGSPLFSFESTDRLGQAIHGFLTPGQIADVTRVVAGRFQGAFQQFREQDKRAAAEDDDGARKKRKKSTSEDVRIDPEWCAVEFALVCRMVVVILSSLTTRSTLEDSRQELHDIVEAACASVIPRALKGTLKALGGDNRRGTWAWQTVGAGVLLVYYDRKSHGWPSVKLDEEIVSQLRALLGRDDVLPEFSLTIVRTLLNDAAIGDGATAQGIIDAILRCLEGFRSYGDFTNLRWSGKNHELGSDTKQTVVAILHLTLSRWISLCDSRASAEQLSELAKIILTISRSGSSRMDNSTKSNQQLTLVTVLAVTLHRADIWELRRFRDAFLAQLQDCTAALASINAQKLLPGKRSSVPRRLRSDISASLAGFEILLHMPEEYLSRTLRSDFLRRALVADVLIGTGAITDGSINVRSLLVVREFIRRAVSHVGSVDQHGVDDHFGYLLKSDPLPQADVVVGEQHDLVSVTLDLIGIHLASFIRNSRTGENTLAVTAIQDIKGFLGVPAERRARPISPIANGTLLRLISIVATDYELSQLSQQLQDSLRGLHERLVVVCSAELLRMSHRDQQSPHTSLWSSRLDALRMWSHTLWLGRWIQADMSALPRFGSVLLGQLIADSQQAPSTAICLSLLDVLKEELYSSPTEDQQIYMGCLVAVYMICSRRCDSAGVQALDTTFSDISKSMSATDYSNLVDYIVEASIMPTSFSTSDTAALIRLLRVSGLSAPEGTSKITHQAVSRTLMLCADRPDYLAAPEIRREILGLLSGYCSDRPASVRPSDMSTIWSILGQLLANSSEHSQTTDPTVFQEVINIVSALVRLRRDLILNTLPHLGVILRRSINALRGLRPQLGAKQTRLVMNTLPAWISAEKPLSAEEARALARLMTTLTTKTIVRTHGQNADSQKPESLVRPFSKHAAYVLSVYIEAVNDPLCVISSQVRKELQPGLFALCDMLGDHNRDAMMVSALDASGKVTMKALWKEYEKQRYVGRG